MNGRALGLLLVLAACPAVAAAQDSVIVINPDAPGADSGLTGLPPEILQELLDRWNDSATVRLAGGLTLLQLLGGGHWRPWLLTGGAILYIGYTLYLYGS